MKKLTRFLFISLISFALFGCGAQSSAPGDSSGVSIGPREEVILNLVVRQAVVRALANKPDRAVRAKQIIAQARAVVSGDLDATVALAVEALRSAIKWDNLSPADKVLIEDVLALVKLEVEKHVGNGVLNPEQRTLIVKLLQSAEEAADLAATIPR